MHLDRRLFLFYLILPRGAQLSGGAKKSASPSQDYEGVGFRGLF